MMTTHTMKDAYGSRSPFAAVLENARMETDKLFALVREGFLYKRPIPERHRLIFYLGHLEAFDWNQLAVLHLSEPRFHPAFDRLFEAGIDPAVGATPSDTPGDWPRVAEVIEYNHRSRSRIDHLIDHASEDIIQMIIEHRLMHAETLAYILHNMPFSQKDTPAVALPPGGAATEGVSIKIPAGRAVLGKNREDGFGWDNEFPEYSEQVPAFHIDKYMVTNGEYLEFVRAGAEPPFFWTLTNGAWHYRGMFAHVPLPLDSPVYVTHQEAHSYSQWKGKSLPTEAQFHRAAYGTPSSEEVRSFPWGETSPSPSQGNFDFTGWDPISVYATPAGDSAFGVSQLAGNGWEWTSTVFHPFPGFQSVPTYPGYSANFFDGEHYVLKGGSPRTASRLLRRTFRNWFRPNYPYLYAGFRCVVNQ
ncbi:MAG: SUMF1/EgtB/PvdO family nonheme iron enzyme [Bryobacteraceae bacterium]